MSRAPIHPGEILADELEEVGVTPTALARQIDVPANRISEIIRGRRSITGDTALRLGHWFGTSPQFWLNLQTGYDLRVAADQAGDAIEKLPRRDERQVDPIRPQPRWS
jgi:addiction module HigA family antidote